MYETHEHEVKAIVPDDGRFVAVNDGVRAKYLTLTPHHSVEVLKKEGKGTCHVVVRSVESLEISGTKWKVITFSARSAFTLQVPIPSKAIK